MREETAAPKQRVRTIRGAIGRVLGTLRDAAGREQVLVQGENEILDLTLGWKNFIRPFVVQHAGEEEARRIETMAGFPPERPWVLTLCLPRDLEPLEGYEEKPT